MIAGALQVESISVRYGRKEVVSEASLPVIEPGQILALVGPNAAGKSTLLRALAGLLPCTGSVRLGGMDLQSLGRAERAARITYMPQAAPAGVGFTVLESVIGAHEAGLGRIAGSRDKAIATLDRLGLMAIATTSLDRLSGGQRQLAGLAQALVREPQVILLDEPTSALDLKHQRLVMDRIAEASRSHGMIVVMVVHDLALAARWADLVTVLDRGRVAASGCPERAITTRMLRETYDVEAVVGHDAQGHLFVTVTGH